MGGFGSGPLPRTAGRRENEKRIRMPDGLPTVIEPTFRRLVKRLSEHGITQLDADMIGQYAAALYVANQALNEMVMAGVLETDTAHNGERRKHPAFTVWKNASALALQIGQQFGATLASRTRLGLEAKQVERSLADILFEAVQ